MGTLAWKPHKQTVAHTYDTGASSTTTTEIPTVVSASSSKSVVDYPPFIPGQFNIKPYSVFRLTCQGSAGSLKYTRRASGLTQVQTIDYTDGCRSNSYNGLIVAPPTYEPQEKLALQEVLAKLNEAVWDAGVDLAEITGTFNLIKDGLKLLASPKKLPDLVRKLWHGVPPGQHEYSFKHIKRDAKKGLKKAADIWLCWRYGVMPAIMSIQDALELLEKQLEKAGSQIRTKRRRPAVESTKSEKRGSYTQTANYVYEWKPRIEAIVYYRRTMDQTMQQMVGLSPEKIPEILWEVTTLSFVWDWFFNVGALLGSLRPKVGIVVLGTSVSTKIEGRLSIIQLFRTQDGAKWLEANPFRVNIDSFKREVTVGGSVLPTFTGTDGLTWQREIDAAALALKPSLKLLRKNASLFGRK